MPLNFPVRWGQITGIESCTLSTSHGISPSIATIVSHHPPPQNLHPVNRLTVGPSGVGITWEDAALSQVSYSSSGGHTWTYQIVDRRWRWAFGEVNGHWNRRLADGSIEPRSIKTTRDLVTMCLEAMGEHGVDASIIVGPERPEVKWDAANPARELLRLVEAKNVRIMLDTFGRARLWKRGEGPIPGLPLQESFGDTLAGPGAPDVISVRSNRVERQKRVRLEAVGFDHQANEIKLIDDLPYRPTNGWQIGYAPGNAIPISAPPGQPPPPEINKTHRKWANECIYRWYRIAGDIGSTDSTIDGIDIDDYEFLSRRVETQVSGNWKVSLPVRIFGKFNSLRGDHKNITGEYGGNESSQRVSFDPIRQLFIVGDPLYLIEQDGSSSENVTFKPAELVGELGMVRLTDGVPERLGANRILDHPRFHTPDLVIKAEDATPTSIQKYSTANPTVTAGNPVENFRDVAEHLESVGDAAMARYQITRGQQGVLIGLWPIELNGIIEQVSYTINESGQTTTVSIGIEHSVEELSFAEKTRLSATTRVQEKQEETFSAELRAKL